MTTATAPAPPVTRKGYPTSVLHAGVDHYEAGHAAAYADYAYDGGGLHLQAQLASHPKYPRRQGYGLNHRGRRYDPTRLYRFQWRRGYLDGAIDAMWMDREDSGHRIALAQYGRCRWPNCPALAESAEGINQRLCRAHYAHIQQMIVDGPAATAHISADGIHVRDPKPPVIRCTRCNGALRRGAQHCGWCAKPLR